ncbi:MAG: CubicO group peptidase (beta-lactamase class C family) [Planctomycetota bacterium]|jgi:CubicO group peptidase (beta-lactamase class C family)
MICLLPLTLLVGSIGTTTSAPTQDTELELGVRKLVQRWSGEDTPGGAICVLRDGEPIVLETFGMADLDAGTPITETTPFYIASTAKTITALCATLAANDHKLDLDASVLKTFPELPDSVSAATLRQAMSHTSGLVDVYDAAIVADLPIETISSNANALEFLAQIPAPHFTPGSRLVYSNSGYMLLAEAIERGTGMDLADYAQEHVFDAFGMQHAYYLGEQPSAGQATSYRQSGTGWQSFEIKTGLRGPGGVFASMQDMIHFDRGLRSGLAPELRSALFTPLANADHPSWGRYAAGWMIQTMGGLRVQRHPGGAFGFQADMLRFPDEDVTVIVLANAADISAMDLSEAVARLTLTDEMEAAAPAPLEAVPLSRTEQQRFGRLWRSPTTGEIWFLSPRETGAVVYALGDMSLALTPVSKSRLEAPESQVPFAVELDGEQLVISIDERELARLEALPFPPKDLAPTEEYEGEYGSDDLACSIILEALPDGRLRLRQENAFIDIPPFTAFGKDLYLCDKGAQIDFHRDDSGTVIGLTMHGKRAWGLEFVRY